jgi:hypothetical protein
MDSTDQWETAGSLVIISPPGWLGSVTASASGSTADASPPTRRLSLIVPQESRERVDPRRAPISLSVMSLCRCLQGSKGPFYGGQGSPSPMEQNRAGEPRGAWPHRETTTGRRAAVSSFNRRLVKCTGGAGGPEPPLTRSSLDSTCTAGRLEEGVCTKPFWGSRHPAFMKALG